MNDAWDLLFYGEDVEGCQLDAVFVLGDIVAGQEAGLALPGAGEDREWLKANIDLFRERAQAGEETFVELMRETAGREDSRGIL